MDPNSSGEGVTSVSSSIKRGLSVDSAQEVKRFRTATGAISTVRAQAWAAGGSFLQELGLWAGRRATHHEAHTPLPGPGSLSAVAQAPPFAVEAVFGGLPGVPWCPARAALGRAEARPRS